ncbi:MAG TPA: hypothetical protein DD391_03510 [Clostridiales bacterium]|nr:hypothetical protein [Clostridiales bacterium]HBL81653.1 hypothetical protein [Clostridiales bacterium]
MLKMKNLTKYGPMLAKVSVLNRGLLKSADYEELMNKTSVSEVASFLKNQTVYSVVLAGSNESLMHREELEERLNDAFAVDFEKIYSLEDAGNKKFLSYVFIRSEVEVLKNILRRIENGRPDITISVPSFYRRHYSIDVEKLAKSKSVREFLENLNGSRYEMQIRPHLTMEEHQNIFSVESALDMYYYTQIRKLTDELTNKADKNVIAQAVGAEIDALNLMWIYRLKKYFGTNKDLTYAFLIPNKFRLKKNEIIEFVQTETVADFLALAAKTPYGGLFSGGAEDVFLGHRYKNFVYNLHRKLQMEYPFTLTTEVSYLHFKEQEIKNITSIAEGIRYGLPPDRMKRYVVGYLGVE